ncbi:hypothetical protein, partial [Neptunomonas sp.]|uniref:hypothetical protein n=1 Tax=Neptunomonas sp. TaxID=1971898 RepID=UPI0035616648
NVNYQGVIYQHLPLSMLLFGSLLGKRCAFYRLPERSQQPYLKKVKIIRNNTKNNKGATRAPLLTTQ